MVTLYQPGRKTITENIGKSQNKSNGCTNWSTRALSQNMTPAPAGALTPNLKNFKVTVQNKLHYCRIFSGQIPSMKINLKLWFLCTALPLNEIYLPMKFHVDDLHSFKVMLRTKKGQLTDWLTDWRMRRFIYATLRGHKNIWLEKSNVCYVGYISWQCQLNNNINWKDNKGLLFEKWEKLCHREVRKNTVTETK